MSLTGTGNPVGRPSGVGKNNSEDDDVLEQMRKRFGECRQAHKENRENYVKNVRISSTNDQWDAEVKKRRGSNRPALTFNQLNLIVKQIIGDYRQNKMEIKVLPSGGPATEEVADIIGGILRNIQIASRAEEAYTNALDCACRGGFGYFRILPEYERDDVFEQRLTIAPIINPLSVEYDPNAVRLSREDAEYWMLTEVMSKDRFKQLYPKATPDSWSEYDALEENDEWLDGEQVRVCEYFTKQYTPQRLVAFDSGAVIVIKDDNEIEALKSIGWNPVKERTAQRVSIKWRKCSGIKILEEREYNTKYCPIIPVLGEEVNVDGKSLLRSSIYYAVDAQHSYNYERSASIERSALAAKAPWLLTQKMIEMWRRMWDGANTTPLPYLLYTPDAAQPNGPQRIEPPNPSGADLANSQAAALDIQRTTGIFDAQIGQKSNVVSGVGLSEQQSQGMTTTFVFPDNLRAAIEHAGKVLIDWIPEFYDTERVVRTINSEDDVEMQAVNQKQENPLIGVTEILNDITVGEYDVIVTAGKAFASRRQEAVESTLKWAQAFPQQAPLVADIMLENMDIPGGEVMAERIKRSLPPQITTDPDSPEGQQAAAQAQAQQQQQQQLQQQLIEGKIQVEQGKNQAQMAKAGAEVQRANAEVVKAKADTIQAMADVQNTKIEHAMNVLDASRMGTGATNGNVQSPSAGPPAVQVPETSRMHNNYGSRKEDVERARQKDEEDMRNAEELKQMIAASHQQHQQALHALTNATVQGHQHIAQALAHNAAIASAPVEAIRDKTGRIVGSRKVMNVSQ